MLEPGTNNCGEADLSAAKEPDTNMSWDNTLECCLGESLEHTKLLINVLLVFNYVRFSGQHGGTWLVVRTDINQCKCTSLLEKTTGFGEDLIATSLGSFMKCVPLL